MDIGWIGTGIMGLPMSTHVLEEGHNVYVFNRTKKKAATLLKKGAKWCSTPKEVAQSSEVVFLMLGDPNDVRKVTFGPSGVLNGARLGSTIIDMTTSSPELSKLIDKEALFHGFFSLDAPVSGGDIGAKEGKLAIMVGGNEDVYRKNLHLFELFGEKIAYMGGSGNGQHAKMSNQILVAGTMIGVVESLLYAKKCGMDIDNVIDVIGKGAASSWSINILGKKIAKGDFNPGFFIKHFVKDMKIVLEEAERMNLCLPGLALVKQFYISAVGMGYANLGTQGLYKVLEKINQIS